MANCKQSNNYLEETDLDLDKIIKRIKELHIQKTASNNGSVSRNSKLDAVENLKQVFNEVISEEKNKVVDNDVKKYTSGRLVEKIECNLKGTPYRQNNKANKINCEKKEFSNQMKNKYSVELTNESLELAKRYDLRNTPSRNTHVDPKMSHIGIEKQISESPTTQNQGSESSTTDNQGSERDRYDFRSTPSRMSRIGIEKQFFESSTTQNQGSESPTTEDQGSESPTTEKQGTERDPYDLRSTPSRMSRIGIERQFFESSTTQNQGSESPTTKDQGSESPTTEDQGTERDPYDLRSTPSRMSRIGIEKQFSESPTAEDQGSESPTTENQGTERASNDIRSTPSRMSHKIIERQNSDSPARGNQGTDIRLIPSTINSGEIEKQKEKLIEIQTRQNQECEKNQVPILKFQNNSAAKFGSSKTTTTNMYQKNPTEYSKQSDSKTGKCFFRCSNSNLSDTQQAKKQSLHQRAGNNSREDSYGRSSPKTYRLFNDNSSYSRNVPLKLTPSSYSSPNLRKVVISNQATSKLTSQEVTSKDSTHNRVTTKNGKSSENGTPMNERVAKISPTFKRNVKKCPSNGRTPFREKSQTLNSNQSAPGDDDKLKMQFTARNLKENQNIQNF